MKRPPQLPDPGRAVLAIEQSLEGDEGQFTPRGFHHDNLFLGDGARSRIELMLTTAVGTTQIRMLVSPEGRVCFEGPGSVYVPQPGGGDEYVKLQPVEWDESPGYLGEDYADEATVLIDRAHDQIVFINRPTLEEDYPDTPDPAPPTKIAFPLRTGRQLALWLGSQLLADGDQTPLQLATDLAAAHQQIEEREQLRKDAVELLVRSFRLGSPTVSQQDDQGAWTLAGVLEAITTKHLPRLLRHQLDSTLAQYLQLMVEHVDKLREAADDGALLTAAAALRHNLGKPHTRIDSAVAVELRRIAGEPERA